MAPYFKDGGCTSTKREGQLVTVPQIAVWLQHCLDQKALKEAQNQILPWLLYRRHLL